MSGMPESGHSGACSVCSAFNAASTKLLWPLAVLVHLQACKYGRIFRKKRHNF